MKRILPRIGIALIFLAGLAVLLYPSLSNWIYERNTSRAIVGYAEAVETLPSYDKEEQLRLATEYNNALSGVDIQDPFVPGSGVVLPDNYISVLNIGGIMGYLDIPKINVHLPIRHGTSEITLRRAVGHIEATAFPIGGEGNHSVLTAHRGLAKARLFTDLDQMEAGDVFLLHIMGDTLAYQVDQIVIVEPEQTDFLRPVAGKDYVTLITCTPYAVNSHRLLVRGERIPYTMEDMPQDILDRIKPSVNWRKWILVGFAALWTVFILFYCMCGRRRRRGLPPSSPPGG